MRLDGLKGVLPIAAAVKSRAQIERPPRIHAKRRVDYRQVRGAAMRISLRGKDFCLPSLFGK
jgi:hypothetical protein